MSKTWPECDGPCPMDEIRPRFYRCKRCGYEKDYRRRLSLGERLYIGAWFALAIFCMAKLLFHVWFGR